MRDERHYLRHGPNHGYLLSCQPRYRRLRPATEGEKAIVAATYAGLLFSALVVVAVLL